MFRTIPIILVVFVTLLLSSPNRGVAGQACDQKGLTVDYMRGAVSSALRLKEHLDRTAGSVAIIARIGSDISRHGLRFTHAAFARKRKQDGQWIVTHLLNECGTDRSYLANHGLLQFLMDDLLELEVLVVVPSQKLQDSLFLSLESGRASSLYQPSYNLISNPSGPLLHQNSNHWVLDVLAQAQARVVGKALSSRKQTQRYFLQNGFRGSQIAISSFERLGASIARSNVHFDDHPSMSERRGKYEVVSVKSVVEYLMRNGLRKVRIIS